MATDWAGIADKIASFLEPLLRSAVAPEKSRPNRGWAYQLQNADFAKLAALKVAYIVVDHEAPTKADIHTMKQSGAKVLGYISIGEAEDYRSYWGKWGKNKPIWLDKENPDWKGNYKVKFWEPAWQAIVYQQIERMVTNGFDGCYLDIIDAYEYYDAPRQMITFVTRISKLAKSIDDRFLVIPQNGSGLLVWPQYAEVIDGIAREDIWFGENGDFHANNSADDYVAELKTYVRNQTGRKPVILSVEYGLNERDSTYYVNSALNAGFIPLIAGRALSEVPRPIK